MTKSRFKGVEYRKPKPHVHFRHGMYRKRPNTSSEYWGVTWDSSRNKWLAHIHVNHKMKHLGRYDTEEEAAHAHDEAALATYGIDAQLNFET